MKALRFNKELYSKTALIKAAYNFTDRAYLHLDASDRYYEVTIVPKDGKGELSEQEFINEMLAQSVRHEIYGETKSIRTLLLARALATSVVGNIDDSADDPSDDSYSEDSILKDWFVGND